MWLGVSKELSSSVTAFLILWKPSAHPSARVVFSLHKAKKEFSGIWFVFVLNSRRYACKTGKPPLFSHAWKTNKQEKKDVPSSYMYSGEYLFHMQEAWIKQWFRESNKYQKIEWTAGNEYFKTMCFWIAIAICGKTNEPNVSAGGAQLLRVGRKSPIVVK